MIPKKVSSALQETERSMAAYDPDNIFAKILRGEIPCHKIYEDDDALAFLDIMPRSEGHTLVITKKQATNLFAIGLSLARSAARIFQNHFDSLGR